MTIEVYAVGICAASACAEKDTPREEIERVVNNFAPTGIESRWAISEDGHFANGEPMPAPCNNDPERQHWLLNC